MRTYETRIKYDVQRYSINPVYRMAIDTEIVMNLCLCIDKHMAKPFLLLLVSVQLLGFYLLTNTKR